MEFLNQTPFEFALTPWEADPGRWRLTLIVKGTFDLAPDGVAVPAAEQRPPTGDEPYPDVDDDLPQSIRYPSDFAFAKPQADILLAGTCHAPQNTPAPMCKATIGVGTFEKSVLVFGARHWEHVFGLLPTATEPEPFSSVELRYENSYGGPGFQPNPIGRGREKIEGPHGARRPLPLMEPPEALSSAHGTANRPVGFGPLHDSWPPRREKTGTYKADWLKKRWPCLPVDFDWSFFNAAPPDQQLDGFLTGDEPLFFENLHPVHARYRARLPGTRVRCFLRTTAEPTASAPPWIEAPMRLDTLWADMDAEQVALVWRGHVPVTSADFEDVQEIYVVGEPTDGPARSAAEWEQTLRGAQAAAAQADEPEPEPARVPEQDDPATTAALAEADAQLANAEKNMRKALADAGLDPDKTMEEARAQAKIEQDALLKKWGLAMPSEKAELTRASVLAAVAKGESLADKDLRGLDLSRAALVNAGLAGALLQDVDLSGSDLSGADLEGANLSGACLRGSRLLRANLKDADFTRANLEQAALGAADAHGAVFEGVRAVGADMSGMTGKGAVFAEADLTDARMSGCQMASADFSDAILDRTDLQNATLTEGLFAGARGAGANLSGATPTDADFSGCAMPDASFRHTHAQGSVWEGATLLRADFTGAELAGADFGRAQLDAALLDAADARGAVFAKASLKKVRMQAANLFQGSLEEADLTDADLSGSNLYGAELLHAVMEKTNLKLANLKMTKLA
jgi:uncharacterized protein YjbI with pentapeptide repeats